MREREPDSRHGFLCYDRLAHELQQGLVIERFRQKTECPCVQCCLPDGQIVSSGNKDDSGCGRIFSERRLHFQAVHVRHPDVKDRHAAGRLTDRRKKGGRVAEFLYVETVRLQ